MNTLDLSQKHTLSLAQEPSGVGVLDKITLILRTLQTDSLTLQQVAERTQIPRPTAHRLILALEHHGLVQRRDTLPLSYQVGPFFQELSHDSQLQHLTHTALPLLTQLRDETGLSAQIFVPEDNIRRCIAAVEPTQGLRDTVPAGSRLSLSAGSAARVFHAWQELLPSQVHLNPSVFDQSDLATVRNQGWAHSVGEREPGVGSVSAPVFQYEPQPARTIAALSLSGPALRFEHDTTVRTLASAVQQAATTLSTQMSHQ